MAEFDHPAVCLDSLAALVKLGASIDDVQWSSPTDCPRWTVGDIYAHISGLEKWITEGAVEFTEPTQDWIDGHVAASKGRPRQELLDELDELISISRVMLPHLPDMVFSPILRAVVPRQITFGLRVLDLFTHEHDIRLAIGRPGYMGGPAGEITRRLLVNSLPRMVAKGIDAPPGAAIRITAFGDAAFDAAVRVGEDGRGTVIWPWDDRQPTTAHITLGWDAFARLATGRGSRADHDIVRTGDVALADRLISRFNVAP